MSDPKTFFKRVGDWFKMKAAGDGGEQVDAPATETTSMVPIRSSFFRPWARRDAAIANLQQGFNTLTDLMSSIRESMERQSGRQDEMLSYLSHLPEVLKAMPEAQRLHGQTLQAIGQQLQQQVEQQDRLVQILDKVTASGVDQRELLEELHQRVDSAAQQNSSISENLRQVTSAVESMGRLSESSTQALRQLHEGLSTRQEMAERSIQKQDTRLTAMMMAAVILSAAALIAVGIFGFLLLRRG